ncbi:MAG: hypothetical protein HPY44_19735 [Armatimonadetes bacterium]|nr:hypothetical protein [Armatimonadota bacterium]
MSKLVVAVILVLCSAVPVLAGDIVSMPTGNVVAKGQWEANAIYWNRPMNTDTVIGELFYGVTDWLEVDLWYADVDSADSYFQANAYVTLVKETADHPSLIVGATNITGEDWIGGQQFMADLGLPRSMGNPDYDDPSLFVLGAFNLAAPAVPTWKAPLVRLHLGWGEKQHDSELFGGFQFKFTPKIGAAILNYRSMPAYMATYCVNDKIELTAGQFDGDTFFRGGIAWDW